MTASAANHLSEQRRGLLQRIRAARLETTLAVTGFVVIAVHILDDNFLQPQPGTSAGDHLVSGLVPLAVYVGAAFAFPRLRAGAQGTLAISLGILGIAIGVGEAGYYTLKVGPSGDDYTGLLAIPASLVLMGVGAATLWRSRRRGGNPAWRIVRRILLGAGGALVLFFVVYPFAASYVYTHAARTETPSGDLGVPYETVTFTTSDGLELDGWYVPSKNRAAVIVFPGKKGTQNHARMLVRHGYGVLVFDRRGEGVSDGDPNALGWAFNRDLKAALAFLQHRTDVDPGRIGGLGLSVGGEALLQTAAETRALGAVVSEGAGTRSVREELIDVRVSRLPETLIWGMMTAGTALFANQAPPPSLEELARRIEVPVSFIYASKGMGGEDHNPAYYAATRSPKEIWKIETTHTHGLRARPVEYEQRVVRFFDRALLPS